MPKSNLKYKRILLKLSGEMMGGAAGSSFHGPSIEAIAREVAEVSELGVQTAVVIGGGNIFRGAIADQWGMDRAAGDYMGMLATVMNALALQDILEQKFNTYTRVLSAITMQAVAEPYIRRKAIKHLERGRVVIFAAGTGNPFFTTDTAASLRAREIGAEVLMKATKVDGIYDADPIKNPKAKKFTTIAYLEAIQRKLEVMDATALTLCMEAALPILVFKMGEKGCVVQAVRGKNTGTLVC